MIFAPQTATPLRAGHLALLVALWPTLASPEGGVCRLVRTASNPPLDVLQCPRGPTVKVEAGSDVRLQGPAGRPSGIAVDAGAVLVETPPGYPGGFQVTTPRAIASVRGTRWTVDVSTAQTSVLALRGHVSVVRRTGGRGVALRHGDGVDVGDDAGPLQVKRWAAARVAKLLARFGE